jgi:N-acetylneuraminic acid mutarotase
MMSFAALAAIAVQVGTWTPGPPLPTPVSNNAVAAVQTADGWEVYSLLGLDESKVWTGVHSRVFRYQSSATTWTELEAVEGPGRLAGTAQTVGGLVLLFGGYTVAEDGTEKSVPSVNMWDPVSEQWGLAAPIPIPTDDAVSGTWGESTVYLVSGWHDTENISDVQGYDATRDAWFAATPIPGPPVFGHAGAISGNTIVYIDGVRVDKDPRAFVLEASSWRGDIDPSNPSEIAWREIAAHPGPPLYRAASVAIGPWVIFAGGTDNPYNYNGIGYNGEPAHPRSGVIAYNVEEDRWVELPSMTSPSMDHRGMVRVGNEIWILGGMDGEQRVSARVTKADLGKLLGR